MIAIISILIALLAGATAFIFWLLKVLKNTLHTADGLIDIINNKTPRRLKEAYDGKYFPAAVIAQVQFNSLSEGKIIDWSLYEKYKIVGFTILTTDKPEDYYGKEFIESLDEEMAEELYKPVIIKKALVYQPYEGDWLWKSVD